MRSITLAIAIASSFLSCCYAGNTPKEGLSDSSTIEILRGNQEAEIAALKKVEAVLAAPSSDALEKIEEARRHFSNLHLANVSLQKTVSENKTLSKAAKAKLLEELWQLEVQTRIVGKNLNHAQTSVKAGQSYTKDLGKPDCPSSVCPCPEEHLEE